MLDLLSLLSRPNAPTLPRPEGAAKTLVLATLALAALAPAQTVVLTPAVTSGYLIQYSLFNGVYTGTPFVMKANDMKTQWYYDSYSGIGYRPDDGKQGWVNSQSTTHSWWKSEFKLPVTPPGMELAAAAFSATASGAQTVGTSVYLGSGALQLFRTTQPPYLGSVAQAVPGAFSKEVTSELQALIAKSAIYAGVEVAPSTSTTVRNGVVSWSSPRLTLTYGYRLRALLALGNFYGDTTKVPVAYEIRKPGTRTVVASGTLYPDASGTVFPVLASGTWDVSVLPLKPTVYPYYGPPTQPSHWLRRTLHGVVVNDGSSTLPAVPLVNGDANGDNVVSAADRAFVTSKLGTYLGGPGYDAAADLTGDGFVTAKDRALVTLALGTAGDD